MAKVATKKAKIMPAKKKIAPKKNIDPSKQLEAEIKKLGFNIEKSLTDSHVNYDLRSLNSNDNYITGVSFDIQALEYCCGVKEAGGLYIDEHDDIDNFTKEQKVALEMLTALAFIDAANYDVRKRPTDKYTMYRPLIFCSNGQDECITFEAAARKYLRGIYKLVSTSRNPGSLSIIKTYISQA